MKLLAKRGRDQQGLCFVSTNALSSSFQTCEIISRFSSIYADVKCSEKVPEGIIILDARIYDMLDCDGEEEIRLNPLHDNLPICTEIHFDVISNRALQNHIMAQAISKRIDDFKEYFEGLVVTIGQEFTLTNLGVSFVVRHLSPTESKIKAARIKWNSLLKIHLGAEELQQSNIFIIIEVAAATHIVDVSIDDTAVRENYISRHKAILQLLDIFQSNFRGYSSNSQFAGIVYSDEVLPFPTFNSQTGEEQEITPLCSASLIEAFRKWVDTSSSSLSTRPSNPGAALKFGLDRAQTLHEINDLPTIVIFFSSGVYSTGQNPVKITRTNLEGKSVKILSVSVGKESATDIMEAIAKEGNGISIHVDSEKKLNLIVDAINKIANR
ncbi:MAG: vWA domain-containing protein [Candidatus Thorarchaeota archaeon SMTZ1-45]|nr:MAG: hypothetical protein AM325_10295 [Candidatus Thorarchaeota archaeon SMTZ1-45]